jgi:DNA-directed RNA polymerase subunit K
MDHTKFEKARIIGARSLQIAMGAPILIKRPKDMINPIDIAELEFENDVLPITVKRIRIEIGN